MKNQLLKHLFCTVFIVASAGWAQANLIEMQVNQSIPDGDLSGLASTINLSGLSDPVGNLQVDLNISGTYNGDLYAYLTHGSGFTVLLNRVGTTAGNNLGYGDHGLNVTFGNSAPDVHNYQVALAGGGSLSLGGPLTGTWGPDGRASSPLTVTDADSRSAFLSSFRGSDPNGPWTLFVADVNGGDLHLLNGWGLEMNALVTHVPDSGATAALLVLGLSLIWLIAHSVRNTHSPVRWFAESSSVAGKSSAPSAWKTCCAELGNSSDLLRSRDLRSNDSVESGESSSRVTTKRRFIPRSYLGLVIRLAMGTAFAGLAWAGQDGSVTGWGTLNAFPPDGYGARFKKIFAGPFSPNRAITTDGKVITWGLLSNLPTGWDQMLDVRILVALRPDGTVVSWGTFNDFMDGPGVPTTPPSGLSDVVAIDEGASFALALKADGTVLAWGLFNGETFDQEEPAYPGPRTMPATVPDGLNGVVAISAGYAHALALKADGSVTAWGRNWESQCDVPSGLNGVVAVRAGRFHSMALRSDGTVVTWGEVPLTDTPSFVPATTPIGLTAVVAISAGMDHSLALKQDGTVAAWGSNREGQCDVPTGLSEVVSVAAGASISLALKSDGAVVAWGSDWGPEGAVAASPSGLNGIVAVGQGEAHSIVVRADRTVLAWGINSFGQCEVPANLSGVVAVAGGLSHSLALRAGGSVVGWGDPSYATVPNGLSAVTTVSASFRHSLALKSDGTVVEWGAHWFGASEMPGGLSEVVSIAAGGFHSLALKSDGTVVAWGAMPGPGFTVPAAVPSGLDGVVAVAAGRLHSLALKADGTVVAWGDNSMGQCDVPDGLREVKAVAAGYGSLALKTDGTVVAWGYWASPVPSGLNGVVAIAAGGQEGLALFDAVNQPPVAGTCELTTSRNAGKSLRLFNLHQACSDPDWDTFIITAISPSSAAAGSAQITGNSVVYTPPTDFVGSDAFTYTVRDSRGASSHGTVNVTVNPTAIGDLNNDGCVDRGDLAILMTKIQARTRDLTYDLNHDGKVDVADARFLALHFTNRDGSPCAP